ncbi:MAG: class I SAM-dependent methyltransferase [Longimicrobiales bacterium]
MADPDWKVVRHPLGYYEVQPKPSREELADYYARKYYQEGIGAYELDYTPDELAHVRLKTSLIVRQVERLRPGPGRLLDIGCGEGWLLDRFRTAGWDVSGVDFSSFGVEKWNPELRDVVQTGDYEELLREAAAEGRTFDVVAFANVIEHVLDPRGLVRLARDLVAPGGLLVIVAPNDFSPLHQRLLETGRIDEPFWVFHPDHLSYFNKASMEALLGAEAIDVAAVVADNPIDLNLLNERMNYVREPEKGKSAHRYRIATDLFLAEQGEDALLDLYAALGSMGVGRNLTYFCTVPT